MTIEEAITIVDPAKTEAELAKIGRLESAKEIYDAVGEACRILCDFARNCGNRERKHTNADLYIRDKCTGIIHRIGDDIHDSLTIDEDGSLKYQNLQNGDGAVLGDNHIEYGYEFVPNEDKFGYNFDPREDHK